MANSRIIISQVIQPLGAIVSYFLSILAVSLLPALLVAAPLQQDTGTNGLVVMEVENFDANTAQGGGTWTEVFSPSGFSGISAHQARPTNTPKVVTGFATQSPQLDYLINFKQTGTHYIWVLGRGDSSASNSIHVGVDGFEVPLADQSLHFNATAGWEWSSNRAAGVMATVEVATVGLHAFNIWMRESGTYVDKVLLTTNAAYIPSGLEQESPRGTNSSLLQDDFNDGNAFGWTIVNNCVKGSSNWLWVNNTYMQAGECRGFSIEGAAIASHALSSTVLPLDVDIQLRLRSEDPALDAVTSNNASIWKFDTMGILFGYQDANNYYRFELNNNKGHRKLWRVQGGVFTELNTSPQSYVRGQWINLRVILQNGNILVFVDGQQVMAVTDSAFSGGGLALFCARNSSCSFDDIFVDAAPATPLLGMNLPDDSSHASSEYFVITDTTVDVSAFTTVGSSIGGIEFVADEGTPGETIHTDLTPPYNTQFILPAGEHSLAAHLLDDSEVRLPAPEASSVFSQVGSGGIHLVGLGDSITNGLFDNVLTDNTSADGRNTGGSYEPILNNHLTAGNGVPVSIVNDGNPGEESWEGAARVNAVLARTPETQGYLVSYGANDSGGSLPTPSGFGLVPGDEGYAGSFKYYMQHIIDAVTMPAPSGAGKLIFLAKAPPYLADGNRNATVAQYNLVIDELVTNGLKVDYPSSYVGYIPPDFHSYFTANPAEMSSDGIHPDGVGYQSMARLWCEALNGQQGWRCLDDDADGLVNSLEATQGTDPAQADSDGDGLVDGADGVVPVGGIVGGVDSNGDGFVDGEQTLGTNPLLADSDGDWLNDGLEVANNADPLDSASWPSLADGDLAPWNNSDGQINAADVLIATQLVLRQRTAGALQYAHGDMNADGIIDLADLLLIQQSVLQ